MLNELASCAISAVPPSGARADRSPAASCCAEALTRRIERAIERARISDAIDRGDRGAGRDDHDLRVGAHVEHHPAGERDGGERHADREEREPGELQPDARRGPQRERDGERDDQARDGDGERERDHGSSL